DTLFESVKALRSFLPLQLFRGLDHLLFGGSDTRVALELLVLLGVERVGQLLADLSGDLLVERLVEDWRYVLAFWLADHRRQLANSQRNLAATLVAELDRAEHVGLRYLLRASFHHHDALLGAGNHNIQRGLARLSIGGIRHVRAVAHADAHAG